MHVLRRGILVIFRLAYHRRYFPEEFSRSARLFDNDVVHLMARLHPFLIGDNLILFEMSLVFDLTILKSKKKFYRINA